MKKHNKWKFPKITMNKLVQIMYCNHDAVSKPGLEKKAKACSP